MYLQKLLSVGNYLAEQGYERKVLVEADLNGEIKLVFQSQPDRLIHDYLLRRGFVTQPDGSYNYRP